MSQSINKHLPRLKIGIVLDDSLDKPDGVQQYVLAVGEWLRQQGQDVHYLVGSTKRTDIEGIHSLSRNVNVRFNGNRMSIPLPTDRKKLRNFLADQKFDVLHIQVPYSPFLAHRLILAAGSRTAVVGTFHIVANNNFSHISTKALGLSSKRSLRRFDAMLSVSTAAADFAKKTFGVKSLVSPNVVDYERFHTAQRLAKYDDDVLSILFLGRLVPRKGCALLLSAIKELKNDGSLPKFRVIICGKGPLNEKLQTYARRNGLSDLVEFVGFISELDKPRYYASADIAVFPSNGGESFGIVLLEAMANGRSVVLGGDNPGYHSVLASRPQLLFDPLDEYQLKAKLAYYLKDSIERQKDGAWGREFSKSFDINIIGIKLLDIYAQALLKRRPR